jgi:hypothetical protein
MGQHPVFILQRKRPTTAAAISGASVLAAALELAARGIRIFPCRQDKAPYTERGFKDATSGNAIITEWWTRWPDALIGVPTGIWFDVLDLDLQHEPARQWLNEHRERLPVTRTDVTRSGGLHLLFKPNAAVKCTASLIAPNIDTRGTGGYIIWWPAHGFTVLNPDTSAPAPAWLVATLNPSPPPRLVMCRRHRHQEVMSWSTRTSTNVFP